MRAVSPRLFPGTRSGSCLWATRGSSGNGPLLIAVIIAAGMALSGCLASASPTTVDGFKPGAMAACSPPVGVVDQAALDGSCAGSIKRATAALDAREPGEAAVAVGYGAPGRTPGRGKQNARSARMVRGGLTPMPTQTYRSEPLGRLDGGYRPGTECTSRRQRGRPCDYGPPYPGDSGARSPRRLL